MKHLFKSLSRFFLLACLLLGGISQAWGANYYTRVTSGTIDAGTYIITNSNHGIMAANAYVKKPTAITANITYDSGNDKFTADEYTNAHAFTVAAGTNNGLTFKYASTHYLYYKGSGTDFTESNTMAKGHEWTVEFDNGYARIKNVNSTGRAIIWNGSAFAPYATSNISSGNSGTNGGVTYSYVYLYKLTTGGDDPTPTTYAVTLASVSNGRISASVAGTPVVSGATLEAGVTVNLEAIENDGYEFGAWDVYKTGESTTKVSVTNNTFTMPDYAVTISATFNEQVVDPTPGGEGETVLAIELDFSNAGEDWGLPTSSRSKSAKTFTYGSYSVAFSASDAGYQFQTNLNVIMGKENASLTLPALPFAVKKIEIVGPESGASGSVTFNLFVGDNAASTAQTGSNGEHTFVITPAYQIPNQQFVLKVTNDNNLQFHSIKFYAASGDANVPTYHTITIADDIVGGVVTTSGRNYILAGTEIELTSISKLGYDFVSWNVKDDNDNPIEVRNNTFTMPSSNVTVSAVFAAKSNTSVFDLTSSLTDQGATVSADLITFDKSQYTLEFIKGTGTAVNNYIPTKNDNVRLYSGNTVQITPKSGYKIKQVHFDMASSSGGQSNWEGTGAVLTNCSIDRGNAANGLPGYVKVLPIDMCGIASVKLKGNTNIIGVMVEYAVSDISINTNGDDTYYATFSSVRDVVFKSCQVFTVNVSGTSLVLNEISDKKVPANTGVLIKATSADAVAFDYLSTPPSAISGTNLLVAGKGVADEDANYKYYKFAYNNYTAKTGLGFYYANEGGTSITCPVGKAYLKVPTGEGAPTRFVFDDIIPSNPPVVTGVDEALNKYVKSGKALINGKLYIIRDNKVFDLNGRLVK